MPRKTPVSAYDPQLLAALIRGGAERVEIRSAKPKEVIALAYELNSLKKRVIAENHPASPSVQRAKVGAYLDDDTPYVPNPVTRKLPPGRPTKVIIQPLGARFGRILSDAGIEAGGPESPTSGPVAPALEPLPEATDSDDELSKLLNQPKDD